MKHDLLGHIDHLTSHYAVPVSKSKEDAWLALSERLERPQSYTNRQKRVKISLFIGSSAAAAVFLVILYIGMFNTGKYSTPLVTAVEQVDQLILPDSSLVVLNSNSNVRYHYNKLTGERNVLLSGEAYFSVKDGKKFTVDFAGGSIKVDGTAFNVVAYDENYLHFACISGRIKVDLKRKNFLLREGETLKVFNGNAPVKELIEPELILKRMQGRYYWNRVPVEELLYFIGKRFAYQLTYSQYQGERNFSGKIDLSDLDNALDIIAFAMDLQFTVDHERQTIKVDAKESEAD
ncbi:FecR family protein [Roseimarinus sediminis]|uniref:FecR family protein n=1 Tax=Roseimarinus sediminis TaxID=1610899 RepID=UPI003D22ACDB